MSAIYDLAARPEYLTPLRQEVEEMTAKYGWTKKAVSQYECLLPRTTDYDSKVTATE